RERDVGEPLEARSRQGGAVGVGLDRDDRARGLRHRGGALAERRSQFRDVAPRRQHPEERLHLPDRRAAVGHSSERGNDRCRRGGTRKFWRCVVVSTELKPCARPRGGTSSFVPSGITPSIASRLRSKSSPEGLKTTKCTPAAGSRLHLSRSLCAVKKNGLSSVLKSARWG